MIIDTTNTNLEYLDATPVVDGELDEQGVLNVALSFFDRVRCLYVNTNDKTIVEGKTYYRLTNGYYVPVSNPTIDDIDSYFEKSTEKEVILFKNYLPMAKLFCCRLYDWSFLTKSMTYEEDDIVNSEEIEDPENAETGTYIETSRDDEGKTIYTGYQMYKNFRFAFNLPEDFIKAKYINGRQNMGFAVKGNKIYCNSRKPTLDYISNELEQIPDDFGYMIAYRVAIELAPHLDPQGSSAQLASSMFSMASQALQANDSFNYRLQNPSDGYFTDPESPYWVERGVTVRHAENHYK